MSGATNKKCDDAVFQQRLILHYSRMADWLEARRWYQDSNVANTVCSLLADKGDPSRVLELCCGSGLLLETLTSAFPHTEFIGVDISPRMVELARKRLSHCSNVVVLKQNWVYDFGSEWSSAFDVIVVKNALHVLKNVVAKLKDLRHVSRKSTSLIVVETVSPSIYANSFIKRLFQFADPDHLKQTFFTEQTLTTALKAAGWARMQYSPTYVRQHIDTGDWLKQRCADGAALENARRLLSETEDPHVRDALDFDADPGAMPTRMLRLQYIAGHALRYSEVRPESGNVSAQLKLPLG
jgi:ubiquinone/menaquinone biosynthesis C-methylase UbiE